MPPDAHPTSALSGRNTRTYDAGGRARALATTIDALSAAKLAGLSAEEIATAAALVNWGPGDAAP